MKNLPSFFLCTIVLIGCIIAFYLVSPQVHPEWWPHKEAQKDSIHLQNAEKNFKTVEEVLIFHSQQLEKKDLDSQFLSMSNKVLTNVTTVLLNKKEPVTVKSIVQEYLGNKIIYDSLAPKDTLSALNAPSDKANNDDLSVDTLVDSLGNKKIIYYKK